MRARRHGMCLHAIAHLPLRRLEQTEGEELRVRALDAEAARCEDEHIGALEQRDLVESLRVAASRAMHLSLGRRCEVH